MISKLGFDGTVNFAEFSTEHNVVKLLDHLTGTKLTQISSLLAGWTLGILLGHLDEVRAIFDLYFQMVTRVLRWDENVTRSFPSL